MQMEYKSKSSEKKELKKSTPFGRIFIIKRKQNTTQKITAEVKKIQETNVRERKKWEKHQIRRKNFETSLRLAIVTVRGAVAPLSGQRA